MQTQLPLMGSTWNSVKSQEVQTEMGYFCTTEVQPGTLEHPIVTTFPKLHLTQTVADEQFKQPYMRVLQSEQVRLDVVARMA